MGDPPALQQDITTHTPTGAALSTVQQPGSAVLFGQVQVQESPWAIQKMAELGGPPGTHGVDVTGIQTFKETGQVPTEVPVTISMVVICPPSTTVCQLDRIFSGTLKDATGN